MADRRHRFNRPRRRAERRPPGLRRPVGGGRTGGAASAPATELGVGTPLDTIAHTAGLGEIDGLSELDVLTIRLNAAREAWGCTAGDAACAPDHSAQTLTKK